MEQQLQQERIVIENDDEIEIDLKDLVLEILSFWKWVLFALIIGAVTAYCISRFVMVPQYESTSQFYVLSKSMPSALDKLRWLKAEREARGLSYLLEVDGGVDAATAPLCVEAGADVLVAGSAVFGAADPAAAVGALASL